MNNMNDTEDKDDAVDSTINAGLAGVAADVVSRYGAGIKEHIVAYGGMDHETGQELSRGLKKISESKVDPQ